MTGHVIALSEAVSLGFHGMGLLAASKKRLSAREMAKILGVSEAHLTKVFQRLGHEGLVGSVRGPGGGFELKRLPEKISLLSIYYAIEGVPRENMKFCSCCGRCPFEHCLFGAVLGDASRDFLKYLDGVTLDAISLKPAEKSARKA
ncbi:MAG: Rrf2 family transcriptional regulator [Synergistaceae bacterium]|nr:Rrf2 family transcriptional regulator [Synergistaceae bacterium]